MLFTNHLAADPSRSRKIVEHGAQLFVSQCSGCHGPSGVEAIWPSQRSGTIHDRKYRFKRRSSELDLFYTIKYGIYGTAMAPWGDRLSNADIWHLIRFLQHSRTRSH